MMINIFLSILGISVSTGLMVIVLILLAPFLNKRYASKWKYMIWIFLSLRLLLPFGGVNGQSVIDMLLQPKSRTAPVSAEQDTDVPVNAAIPSRRIIVEIPAQMAAPLTEPSGDSNMGITLLDLVSFVWITGILIFISIHFISYSHYKRRVMKRGKIVEDVNILSQMFKLKHELHISRTIWVIENHEAESPMVIGFFKPVLILPKEQYNSEELFFILKHELVHLKRGDVYLKLLFVMANAVHWFNPLIWMMQKEAVIDMELSCDEKVTQGTSYAVRKAYTETLLSVLHKGCARRAVLSTQFYGGTKIMKKRFQNILIKGRKKNGISILICAVILTICSGTLVGCSIGKEDMGNENIEIENIENEDAENESAENNNIENENTENMSDQPEPEEIPVEQTPVYTTENTAVLIFSKEGAQELKQATLTIGDGYSIYLPDDEWQKSDSDIWIAAVNEQVRLWITHFRNESIDSVDQELTDDGYVTVQDYDKEKQEGDLIYHVGLKASENDVWGIFYCYPTDAEEGWGRELPVIADTFALSIGADNTNSDSPEEN